LFVDLLEIRFCYIVQVGLELTILLSLLPECWDYTCVPLYLVFFPFCIVLFLLPHLFFLLFPNIFVICFVLNVTLGMQRLIMQAHLLPTKISKIVETERCARPFLIRVLTKDELGTLWKYRRGKLTYLKISGKTTQKKQCLR
jgi:hypothetical protein